MGRKKGERVSGSWRDKGKGECFTRTNKAGGTYVVCNDPPRGSKGQKGVYKGKEGGRKQQKTATTIQKAVRGKQARAKAPKEVSYSSVKGQMKEDDKTSTDTLYLKVVEPFTKNEVGSKKKEYKVKNTPAKTGAKNTKELYVWVDASKTKQGEEEAQFNPNTSVNKKALEEGKIKFIRKKK